MAQVAKLSAPCYPPTMRWVLGIMLAAPLLSGCKAEVNKECRRLFAIIDHYSTLHLTARRGVDDSLFRDAARRFLTLHSIPVPKDLPPSAQEQCAGSLLLAAKRSKANNLQDLSLDLLNAYLRQWDPHSRARSDQELVDRSAFRDGFGFTVERLVPGGPVEVTDVLGGSPAHVQGLREGMLVKQFNGKSIDSVPTLGLPAFLAEETRTDDITIQASGSRGSQTFQLSRSRIDPSPIKLKTLESDTGDIGYIRIRRFLGAEGFFSEGISSMQSAVALILDLRGHAGDFVPLASALANKLVSSGDVYVGMLGRGLTVLPPEELRNVGSIWDGPIVVLVNDTTKSTGEAFAGFLQDNGAIVVGAQTFGKGTIRHEYSLRPYGLAASLELTDAFLVRPSGRIIQGRGVTPDVKFVVSPARRSELDYPRAIPAPADPPPFPAFDAEMLPTASKHFRRRLAQVESSLRAELLELNDNPSRFEDPELEAARRVAAFLSREMPGATETEAQLNLPFPSGY